MQVDNLMVNEGTANYYTDDFRNVMEDFMTVFRTSPTTQVMTIDPGDAVRYEFDFYGLLTYLKVPMQYHYTIMRVNKMTSPTDYRSRMVSFLMPDQTEISRIAQTEQTTTRAST